MFSLLRVILVIGAIFYFSPVRQGQDSGLSLDGLFGSALHRDSGTPLSDSSAQRLESVWNALPESAKQAVIDKIIPSRPARAAETLRVPQADTLQPEDHRPAWIGAAKKPGA
ncbi:hypothetical protein [Microvirga antarctica]|uniref:hypothetical protein n=1 Tax=Microvirga antarctica TaxID=2819233 RepID=UPI001B3118F8|nr:hypothetical protein [Microvirga antarctica]